MKRFWRALTSLIPRSPNLRWLLFAAVYFSLFATLLLINQARVAQAAFVNARTENAIRRQLMSNAQEREHIFKKADLAKIREEMLQAGMDFPKENQIIRLNVERQDYFTLAQEDQARLAEQDLQRAMQKVADYLRQKAALQEKQQLVEENKPEDRKENGQPADEEGASEQPGTLGGQANEGGVGDGLLGSTGSPPVGGTGGSGGTGSEATEAGSTEATELTSAPTGPTPPVATTKQKPRREGTQQQEGQEGSQQREGQQEARQEGGQAR